MRQGDGISAQDQEKLRQPIGAESQNGGASSCLRFEGEISPRPQLLPKDAPGYISQFLKHPDSPIEDGVPGRCTLDWHPGRYQESWWLYSISGGRIAAVVEGVHAQSGSTQPFRATEALLLLGRAVQEMHLVLQHYRNRQPGGIVQALTGDEYLSILTAPSVLARWRVLHSHPQTVRSQDPGYRMNEIFTVAVAHLKTSTWGVKRAIESLSLFESSGAPPEVWSGGKQFGLDVVLRPHTAGAYYHRINHEEKFHCLTYAITVLNEKCQVGAYRQAINLLSWFKTAEFSLDYQSPANTKMSLLMLAAGWGNHHFVEALLDAGANPHLQSESGLQAADYARYSGFVRLASLIEESAKRFKS